MNDWGIFIEQLVNFYGCCVFFSVVIHLLRPVTSFSETRGIEIDTQLNVFHTFTIFLLFHDHYYSDFFLPGSSLWRHLSVGKHKG